MAHQAGYQLFGRRPVTRLQVSEHIPGQCIDKGCRVTQISGFVQALPRSFNGLLRVSQHPQAARQNKASADTVDISMRRCIEF